MVDTREKIATDIITRRLEDRKQQVRAEPGNFDFRVGQIQALCDAQQIVSEVLDTLCTTGGR